MEYYDGLRDPIRQYFSEKIQIAFASFSAPSAKENKLSPRKPSSGSKVDMPIKRSSAEKPLTIKKQKEVRTRQWNFQKKMTSTNNKSTDKLINAIGQLDIVEKQNDTLVERSLRDQNAALQERLRLRRENSINKSVGRMKNNNSNSRKNSEGDDQGLTTPEKLKRKKDLYGKPVFEKSKDGDKLTSNILGDDEGGSFN